MKKILVAIMVLVAISSSTFALNPTDYNVFYKMNSETTFNGLTRYLDVNEEQANSLKKIFSITESKLKSASKNESEADAEKALNFNLGNMKNSLTDSQYKKYLTIVNLTINNTYDEVLVSEN